MASVLFKSEVNEMRFSVDGSGLFKSEVINPPFQNVAINWVLLPSPGGLWGNIGFALGGLGVIWWCFGVALGVALGGFFVTLG